MRKASIPDIRKRTLARHMCEDLDRLREQGFVEGRIKVEDDFPLAYCSVHDEETLHHNGDCLRCKYNIR